VRLDCWLLEAAEDITRDCAPGDDVAPRELDSAAVLRCLAVFAGLSAGVCGGGATAIGGSLTTGAVGWFGVV
jgi:hypothetical protein